jgi:hypothetical protein
MQWRNMNLDIPSVTPDFERFLDGILPELAFLAEYSEERELFTMLGQRLIRLAQKACATELQEEENFFEEIRKIECDEHFKPIADLVLENMQKLMEQTGERELVRKSTECLMQILHYASLPGSNLNRRWAAVSILSTFKDAEEAWQTKLNPNRQTPKTK